MERPIITKLKGSKEWDLWRIRIRALLAEKGYLNTINTKKEFPKGTPKETIEEYKEKRKEDSIKAAALIRLNLGDGPLISTKNINEEDAEELYNKLKALYEPKGFSSEFLLAKELFITTLEGCGNDIERYLTKIRSLTNDLAAREKAIPVEIIAAYTINNLTRAYSEIIAVISSNLRNEAEIDLDDLFNLLIDESRRIDARELKDTALYSRDRARKEKRNLNRAERRSIKCFKCDKDGHYARECREEIATLAL
jgi:hypothetical protein